MYLEPDRFLLQIFVVQKTNINLPLHVSSNKTIISWGILRNH